MQDVKEFYDEVPYFSAAFVDSSVLRLQAIGEFLNINPPPLKNARVLELGSAYGGNILPFAIHNSDADVVGIDISSTQVNDGNAIAKSMGVGNFTLIQKDILNLSQDDIKKLGKFDYIIAHGFFSWVKNNVKDALLAIIKNMLSPNGIAFISYNVYPGWRGFETLRDFMVFTSKDEKGDKKLKKAKSELKFLEDFLKLNLQAQSDQTLKDTQRLLLTQLGFLKNIIKDDKNDYYILHEFLEPNNDPFYFYKFANKLSAIGLSYLAESTLDDIFSSGVGIARFDRHIEQNYKNRIDSEQMRDFLLNRSFRKSLVVQENLLPKDSQTDIGIDEFSRINLIADIKKDDDKFSLKGALLEPRFAKFYEKIMSVYPASVSLDDFDGTHLQDGFDAFLYLMSNPNVAITTKKFVAISYEKQKSRLKDSIKGYISYFANTTRPALLLATELNTKVELDMLGAKTALLFDGKHSIDEIALKFREIFVELNETDVNIFDAKEYVLGVKTKLENAYFLENIS
ncbi:SAM-dependent methyltransferase [Campylobacter mucosalis]|uniref:class I SAM-dependent methyltransferase n=1 Tax=Campylobacter mucosalis TaxID=202 RepID=UPI001592F50B|nr:class I SAM-dependent methyltransferase [Campylobacter mucosalis]QKF62356.1 SAM-dependent methyltransferase [Campylobacter mucosalis]